MIDTVETTRIFSNRADELEPPEYEKRFISSESMRDTQSEGNNESRGRAYEDDPLNGGDLLNVFDNPVALCEVHWVDNPYTGGQPDALPAEDLLDLFVPDNAAQENTNGDQNTLEQRFAEEARKINGTSGDSITRLMAELVKAESET